MTTSIVYLLGSPGVGKRTVAEALAARTGAAVVDNHKVNLPLMSLFRWDGRTELPEEVWGYVERVRGVVLDALAEIAPRDASYVLTNALEADDESVVWFDRIAAVAAARDAVFVPVRLVCDLEEQLRRVVAEDRVVRLKLSDPDRTRELIASVDYFTPTGPTALVLDTTARSAEETAAVIEEHVRSLLTAG